MNIDERLDALTQSLELLSAMHRDLESEMAAKSAETNRMIAERFAETLNFINRLAHVAEIHEDRIRDLEDK